MALNPQYEEIGRGFVQQYYALFDDPTQRPSLVNMYNVSEGLGRFEGLRKCCVVADRKLLHDIRGGTAAGLRKDYGKANGESSLFSVF